jgi:hypothetical protein
MIRNSSIAGIIVKRRNKRRNKMPSLVLKYCGGNLTIHSGKESSVEI